MKVFNRYISIDAQVVNSTLDFDRMLTRLERDSNNNDIYILQWSKDDSFFFFVGRMRSIKIWLRHGVQVELRKLLEIGINFSTAYHHQAVGKLERNHRAFNEYIRAYIKDNITDWDTYLKYFTYFHDNTTNTVFDKQIYTLWTCLRQRILYGKWFERW